MESRLRSNQVERNEPINQDVLQTKEDLKQGAYQAKEDLKQGAYQAKEDIKQGARETQRDLQETVQEKTEDVKDWAQEKKEDIKQGAQNLQEKAQTTKSKINRKVQQFKRQVKQKVSIFLYWMKWAAFFGVLIASYVVYSRLSGGFFASKPLEDAAPFPANYDESLRYAEKAGRSWLGFFKDLIFPPKKGMREGYENIKDKVQEKKTDFQEAIQQAEDKGWFASFINFIFPPHRSVRDGYFNMKQTERESQNIQEAAKKVEDTKKGLFSRIYGMIFPPKEARQSGYHSLKQSAKEKMEDPKDMSPEVKQGGENLKDKAQEEMEEAKQQSKDTSKGLLSRMYSYFFPAKERIMQGYENLKEEVKEKVDDLKNEESPTLMQTAKDRLHNLEDKVSDGFDAIKEGVQGAKENVKEGIEGLRDKAHDIKEGFDHLKEKVEDAKEWVQEKRHEWRQAANEKTEGLNLNLKDTVKWDKEESTSEKRPSILAKEIQEEREETTMTGGRIEREPLEFDTSDRNLHTQPQAHAPTEAVKEKVQSGIDSMKEGYQNLKETVKDKFQDIQKMTKIGGAQIPDFDPQWTPQAPIQAEQAEMLKQKFTEPPKSGLESQKYILSMSGRRGFASASDRNVDQKKSNVIKKDTCPEQANPKINNRKLLKTNKL